MFSITKYLTMIIPSLSGKLDQNNFFVYAAADSGYFDKFGRQLVNSVKQNTNYGVHLHLYNPTPGQLDFCHQTDRVSVTWETFAPEQFESAIQHWSRTNLPEPQNSRKNKMLGLKQFTDNTNLPMWIYKTYYACMRFVRLAEFVTEPCRFLEIDIDGIVRAPFQLEFADDATKDFYLYQKEKGGHLAGAILYTPKATAVQFIKELAQVIRHEIEQDNIYWFLDQHSLDSVIAKYNKGLLPISYVDWRMQSDSAIWSAKGKRKELEIFKQELRKYQ